MVLEVMAAAAGFPDGDSREARGAVEARRPVVPAALEMVEMAVMEVPAAAAAEVLVERAGRAGPMESRCSLQE